ncbi:helix-turn-helix domain-containing protein [Anaerosacchariphilus polymeriproducens]|uniref:AraC family transcriptional regulator n=1 Tax=Anaerosacchariphilus polymeriproducens TaxID=1812858 RepID=A0A371AVY0_9FIRM|nr:helix-turn-helix domain-containing protein [Anaerosacchariphilus polymeriproducens]RDU23692.1 AraC family transcriptional regulator [Anaerosacchariphilus polymeriproducens]
MPNLNSKLSPKQPEFVLATSDYTKKVLMKFNVAHFYQFTAESQKMDVIPDACIDILFWKKGGKLITKIAGTRLEKGITDTDINGEYFGVRFMPGTNPVDRSLPLCEIVNHEWDFEDLIVSNEKKRLIENMFYANTFDKKIKVFMTYYLNVIEKHLEDTKNLKYFLRNEIIMSSGNLKLSKLSTLTGYSERYLNKKIHEDFGINPKNLIQFIRFQKAIGNLTDTINRVNCINTALEAGYYDQSHFIKDFKKFSGQTPINYINNLLCNSYNKKLHVIE